jgi:hypothetical protein
METTDFEPELDQFLARYRGRDARPTRGDLEAIYTRGCAEMLRLESELLRFKRRLIAAEADEAHDATAAREAAELRGLNGEVSDRLADLRRSMRFLRTAVDWSYNSAD